MSSIRFSWLTIGFVLFALLVTAAVWYIYVFQRRVAPPAPAAVLPGRPRQQPPLPGEGSEPARGRVIRL